VLRERLFEIVENTLAELVQAGQLPPQVHADPPRFGVDLPKQAAHGDFSCNVALVLAKAARKKPRDIAQLIADGLVDPESLVEKADIAGPGFLNFFIADHAVAAVARAVLEAGPKFGRQPEGSKGRVLVEYVSANPTGPLHVGHARGAFMGDAASRLLDAAGYEVTREYYVNDSGNQVMTLGRSIHARYRQLYGAEVTLGPEDYPAPYVVDIARQLIALAKDVENLEFRGALMEGQVFGPDQITDLSKYPTREEAQMQAVQIILSPGKTLAGQIVGPGRKVASLIKAIEEKLEKGETIKAAG
jgi:arginyl-tRNA synthetase